MDAEKPKLVFVPPPVPPEPKTSNYGLTLRARSLRLRKETSSLNDALMKVDTLGRRLDQQREHILKQDEDLRILAQRQKHFTQSFKVLVDALNGEYGFTSTEIAAMTSEEYKKKVLLPQLEKKPLRFDEAYT